MSKIEGNFFVDFHFLFKPLVKFVPKMLLSNMPTSQTLTSNEDRKSITIERKTRKNAIEKVEIKNYGMTRIYGASNMRT